MSRKEEKGYGHERYEEQKTNPFYNQEQAKAQDTKENAGDFSNGTLMMGIMSLLAQFQTERVRKDFLNNEFDSCSDRALLMELDELRCILLPRWLGGGFKANSPRCTAALHHLYNICDKSPEALQLGSSIYAKTYADLMDVLGKLANDGYWTRVQPSQRCNHEPTKESQGESLIDKPFDRFSDCSKKLGPPRKHDAFWKNSREPTRHKAGLEGNWKNPYEKPPSSVKSSQHSSKGSRSNQSRPKKPKKIEEIIASDSDSLSSSSVSSSSGSSDSSDSSQARRPRSRRAKGRRAVVAPPIFEMDGKCSLTDFLDKYEKYFEKTQDGDKYDKTQVLANFLKGELLQYYKVRGGRQVKFSKMRKYLVHYYKEQKIGSKKYWRKKLSKMEPDDSEAYDIFGLRLTEVARAAYSSPSEAADQV